MVHERINTGCRRSTNRSRFEWVKPALSHRTWYLQWFGKAADCTGCHRCGPTERRRLICYFDCRRARHSSRDRRGSIVLQQDWLMVIEVAPHQVGEVPFAVPA